MKPQTFEEWMSEGEGTGCCRHDSHSFEERAAMRLAWQAAHENAARVCDTSGFHVVMQTLSDAIRAQGSK